MYFISLFLKDDNFNSHQLINLNRLSGAENDINKIHKCRMFEEFNKFPLFRLTEFSKKHRKIIYLIRIAASPSGY